jgi:hypothetical protein
MLSSRITGVVSDQRVYSRTPGITSRPVAMVVMEREINAATRTLGTKGAASMRSSSMLCKPERWTPRCALLTIPSAYAR